MYLKKCIKERMSSYLANTENMYEEVKQKKKKNDFKKVLCTKFPSKTVILKNKQRIQQVILCIHISAYNEPNWPDKEYFFRQ